MPCMVFLESNQRVNEKGFVLGHCYRDIITAVLSFFTQQRGKPEHGRIKEENSFCQALKEINEVIHAADMCELVQQDGFNLVWREIVDQSAGYQYKRFQETDGNGYG